MDVKSEILELSEETFDQAIQAEMPLLVDFWAAWCAPCRMVAPILEALALEYAGKIRIGKLNVDEASGPAARYGIRSIPTLMVFKQGAPFDKLVGVASRDVILGMIEKHL